VGVCVRACVCVVCVVCECVRTCVWCGCICVCGGVVCVWCVVCLCGCVWCVVWCVCVWCVVLCVCVCARANVCVYIYIYIYTNTLTFLIRPDRKGITIIVCRKKVHATILGPNREEVTKDGDNSTNRSFVICPIPQM